MPVEVLRGALIAELGIGAHARGRHRELIRAGVAVHRIDDHADVLRFREQRGLVAGVRVVVRARPRVRAAKRDVQVLVVVRDLHDRRLGRRLAERLALGRQEAIVLGRGLPHRIVEDAVDDRRTRGAQRDVALRAVRDAPRAIFARVAAGVVVAAGVAFVAFGLAALVALVAAFGLAALVAFLRLGLAALVALLRRLARFDRPVVDRHLLLDDLEPVVVHVEQLEAQRHGRTGHRDLTRNLDREVRRARLDRIERLAARLLRDDAHARHEVGLLGGHLDADAKRGAGFDVARHADVEVILADALLLLARLLRELHRLPAGARRHRERRIDQRGFFERARGALRVAERDARDAEIDVRGQRLRAAEAAAVERGFEQRLGRLVVARLVAVDAARQLRDAGCIRARDRGQRERDPHNEPPARQGGNYPTNAPGAAT